MSLSSTFFYKKAVTKISTIYGNKVFLYLLGDEGSSNLYFSSDKNKMDNEIDHLIDILLKLRFKDSINHLETLYEQA